MTSQNINIQKNNEIDENDNKREIVIFLNKCNISCKDFDNLDGIIISRDILISTQLYETLKQDITKFKKVLKSSIYTSMQKNAENNQRWPLLNLIRQLLRRYNYELHPKRISDGYTKDGKKKYKRFFEIKKTITDNNN